MLSLALPPTRLRKRRRRLLRPELVRRSARRFSVKQSLRTLQKDESESPLKLQMPTPCWLSSKCRRHVATCRQDMACRSNFGQIGPCRRHNIEDDVAVCVGLSRHLPDFPYGDEIFSKTNKQLINNGQNILSYSGFYESNEPPPSGDARLIVPGHCECHRNGQQSGYILHRYFARNLLIMDKFLVLLFVLM